MIKIRDYTETPTEKDNTPAATETQTETEAVTQPIPNQSGSLPGPCRSATIYRWGIPYNFTPHISNGGSFIPY